MKNRIKISLGLLAALLLAACTSEQSLPQAGQAMLDIAATIATPQTRSNVPDMAEAFGSGETIGITALNSDETVYAANRPFTSYGTGNGQKWRVPEEQGIPLPEEEGHSLTVFAYYPYTEDLTPEAIPVNCTNDADQTAPIDWMTGQGANVVNPTKPYTSIAMHHVQTAIRISLSREAAGGKPLYSGTGKVDEVTLTSNGFRTSGTMNTQVTPAAFSFTDADLNTFMVDYAGKEPQIPAAGNAADLYYYVLTTGSNSGITIRMQIDGAEYQITTTALTLLQGSVYHFHLVLTDQLLIMQGISITPWGAPVTISEVSQLSFDNTGFVTSIPGIDMGVTDANGNKVLFAPYNLGTTEPTTLGNLYQWGRQEPVADATFDEAIPHWGTYSEAYPIFLNELAIDISGNPQYDAVVGLTEDDEDWMGWRIPTYDEYIQLANPNKYDVETHYDAASPYIVIIRKSDTTKRLTLPVVMKQDTDYYVYMWTSTPTEMQADGYAYMWYISNTDIIRGSAGNVIGRYVPLPIRPVRTVE